MGPKRYLTVLLQLLEKRQGSSLKGLLMGRVGTQELSLLNCSADFLKVSKTKKELDGAALAAFQSGVEVAYKAVMKPVEGTILTVSRGAAIGAKKKAESTNDAVEVMRAALEGAKTALAKTPDMLPVLKEVGVVDSGGQGLVFIYEGFLSALTGEFIASEEFQATPATMSEMINAEHHKSVAGHVATEHQVWLLYRNHGRFETRSNLCQRLRLR